MTQVELAEDICSTKEIWRIENGKSKPNFFTFERILTKLGIDFSRYLNGFISGDDRLLYYETLEIWDCIFDHDYKSAEIKFFTLKEKEYFNIDDQFCKQFSLICEAILLFELSGKSEEALDLAYKALYTTLPKFNLKYIDKHPLVADEYRILNNIALFHISFDSIDKGVDILRRLKSSLNQKYISKELRMTLLPTICYNLSKFLGLLKLYNESIGVCDEGIAVCREAKTVKSLGELFYNKAYNLYFLDDKIESQKNFQTSYNIFVISGNNNMSDIIEKNAIEKYGISVITS